MLNLKPDCFRGGRDFVKLCRALLAALTYKGAAVPLVLSDRSSFFCPLPLQALEAGVTIPLNIELAGSFSQGFFVALPDRSATR